MSIYIKEKKLFKKELGSYFLPKALLGIDLNKYNGVMSGGLQAYNSSMGTDPGNQAYSTIMGGVSKAGPIGAAIGGITSIGDAIGDPIRRRAEETNSSGGLSSINKATNAGTAGYILNPFKGLTSTFSDKGATGSEKFASVINMLPLPGISRFLSKKRAKRMDEEGKKRVSEAFTNKANLVFGNMLNDQFEMGGEFEEYNKGGVFDYKGATHGQGGIKIDKNGNPSVITGGNPIAEVETDEFKFKNYIFSNTLKYV